MVDCTLVVSSCDKYEDAWYPFFELLKKYWPELSDYPIVMITETKMCNHKGLEIKTLHPENVDDSWSKRLLHCLSQIQTKYIIFSLEDFFIQKQVENQEILKCVERMKKDPEIAVFYFKRVSDSWKESEFKEYFEATPDLKYRLNAQMAIWNREILMEFLDEKENPWEFEILGSQRIKDTKKKLYCHKVSDIYSNLEGVFPYIVGKHNGYGIAQGKWMWNNKKLFKKHRIKVKLSGLGVAPKWHYGIGVVSKIRNTVFPPLVRLRDTFRKM